MAYYICTKCEIRMRPGKNDVRVEEYAGNDPYKIWSADLWKCPSCGIEVIAGFGLNPVAEHFQEKYADFAKSVTHRILEKPKPAPDVGLVQAVKTFLDDEICGGYEKPTWEKHSVRHLQDALAAFEKPEVEKALLHLAVKLCPYCGTELVKRDTTALGGDESFDWCPDCEWVIEDGERMEVDDGA